MRLLQAAVLVIGSLPALSSSAFAQGITRQQADEMLKELRAIRQALERQAPSGAMQLPVPDRTARLQVERGHIFGRPDAPLTMVEFADLQCTYCGRFTTTVFEQIRKTYIDTGVLRVVAWDFPLSIHPEALGAARATRCAGDQGKFWELRQVLLRNADHLSSTFIRKAAGELMLDMRTFDDCVASARHDADIKRDVDEARRAGVQGTPTFLLGRTVGNTVEGVLIAGAKPFEIFDARIRELAAEPSVKLDNRLDTTAARYGRPAEIAAPGSGPIRCATVRGLRHGHHGGE